MKTFDILDYGFESLPTENVDGKRYYVTPTGEKYPSVTSVTGLMNRKGIQEWRKRVGEEKANKISTQAARHGTSAHQLFEDYIRNDNFEEKYKTAMPTTQLAFNSVAQLLNQIGTVHALEAPLYSHELQLAGRVDCIAESGMVSYQSSISRPVQNQRTQSGYKIILYRKLHMQKCSRNLQVKRYSQLSHLLQ